MCKVSVGEVAVCEPESESSCGAPVSASREALERKVLIHLPSRDEHHRPHSRNEIRHGKSTRAPQKIALPREDDEVAVGRASPLGTETAPQIAGRVFFSDSTRALHRK